MIKGAIFDFDGTLFDSMFIWDTVGESYLLSIGYEPKENLNKIFKSMSLYQGACYYQREYGVTISTDEIMEGVNSMVEKYYKYDILPKSGVIEFLKALQAKGVKMCIVTASDEYLVEAALERCGMREYFSQIFTCTSVGFGKDSPVIYNEALKHLNTCKSETLVFEDAVYALRTAKDAGFITVAVYDGSEEEQEEVRFLSDYYINQYCDMESFW